MALEGVQGALYIMLELFRARTEHVPSKVQTRHPLVGSTLYES